MRRRIISIISALTLCLSLFPVWAAAADSQPLPDFGQDATMEQKQDFNRTDTFVIENKLLLITHGYDYRVSASPAVKIGNGKALYTLDSVIESTNGVGVQVLDGGIFEIKDEKVFVTGTTYGLDIASGASVKLGGGTFTGGTAAINAAGGNLGGLLDTGCAFFDADGALITDAAALARAKTLSVRIKPEIRWAGTALTMDYDGRTVEVSELPQVDVSPSDKLGDYQLEYYCKKTGDTEFKAGLPKDAGTYDIKAVLPAQETYGGAETAPCLTLTIAPIAALETAPAAVSLTYNRGEQTLVTAGSLCGTAADDGLEIEFARAEGGPFSTDIPAGTDAKQYDVWYRVVGNGNYTDGGVAATKIADVRIVPKAITPKIDVTEKSYVYDGSAKKPTITVRDDQYVLPDNQYTISWTNSKGASVTELREADTYTATIENVAGGNYSFRTEETVEIVEEGQGALSITGKPSTVYYGDRITSLSTMGGTGNGTVTWSVASGDAVIDSSTGTLDITGTGSVTVRAVRSVPNYDDVEDSWSFTAQPKPVTAVVTVGNKIYDGNDSATVTEIKVSENDLVKIGDQVTVDKSKFRAFFDDVNAGTNKSLTVFSTNPGGAVSGADAAKYNVSFPSIAKADITPKTVTPALTLSGNDLQGSAGSYYYVYDGNEKRPEVTAMDGSDVIDSGEYTVSYSNNKSVGTATVSVTDNAGGNYTVGNASVTFEIKKSGAVLTGTPLAKDLTFNGTEQYLVTDGTAQGGRMVYSLTDNDADYKTDIPTKKYAGTYTVYYKVRGDGDHEDSASGYVSVTIKPKQITPTITLDLKADGYTYNGSEHKPSVTVKDGADTVDEGEYSVSYRNNVNAGTATVTVSNSNGGNYIVNGTAEFTIEKAAPSLTPPDGRTNLKYKAGNYELITRGSSADGTMVYSLDGRNFSEAVPTASAVGTYTVHYMVRGDANHNDSSPATVDASIVKNTVSSPGITISSDTFRYNGSQQKPEVRVYDDDGLLIAENEYVLEFSGGDMVEVGTYTVTVTAPAGSNYVINANNTRDFKIVEADQETISIEGKRDLVYYGDTIQLSVSGGTGDGTVEWSIDADGKNVTINQAGQLSVRDTGGPFKVTAVRTASGNFSKISATWEFGVGAKPITAVLTGIDKVYDGSTAAAVRAAADSADLVAGDSITIPNLSGSFTDANVGENKRINVPSAAPKVDGTNADKYAISYPSAAKASITKAEVDTSRINTPVPVPNLSYTGSAQRLITAGSSPDGTLEYSTDGGVSYSPSLPVGTDAESYEIWYMVRGDGNHKDMAGVKLGQNAVINPQTVTPAVELTPESAVYDGNAHKPSVTLRDGNGLVIAQGEYAVSYDAATDWMIVGTHGLTVTDKAGGNYNITQTQAEFKILSAEQSALSITGKPNTVTYGDVFTLSTSGGSGSGDVTWEITAGSNVAEVEADSGQVRVKASGTATVKATRKAGDNYGEATATWTFTAAKKPITATVSAQSKVYDGNNTAAVSAAVNPAGLLSGDSIVITGLSGSFVDQNVGAGKTVSVNTDSANITGNNAQHYAVTYSSLTATADITKGAAAIASAPSPQTIEYSGAAQELVSAGSTTNNIGKVIYKLDSDSGYSENIPTAVNAGSYRVWYMVEGSSNFEGVPAQSVDVTITPKTVSDPVVELAEPAGGYVYDGNAKEPSVTVRDGANIIDAGEYAVSYSGNTNAGTATVTVTDKAEGNYTVNGTASFKIAKATPSITTPPTVAEVTGEKKLSDISFATEGSANVSGTFTWTNGDTTAEVGTHDYEVTFTPTDTDNYKTATCDVSVTVSAVSVDGSGGGGSGGSGGSGSGGSGGGGGSTGEGTGSTTPASVEADTVSMPLAASVSGGTATASLDTAAGNNLVRTAAANGSKKVVITPEVSGQVSRTEVSLPSAAVSRLGSETDADLTVASPVASVTIPNAALNTLSGAGGTVSVAAEQADNAVTLSLSANGERVDSVPGGVTLTVPVEEAGPGTVAVLVNEDGSRETIRKAVPVNGELSMQLDGSATVEIVDNSRDFDDVSDEDWAAGAVAFASAHELFNGTSATTFSPEKPLTRAMLTTVLYNLEGCPEQSLTDKFSDVSADAWYASSVAWAEENGIADGLGEGVFAPEGNVTREQFAVMLWRYAGSHAADGQELDFTDAEQASGYALDALRWAVGNGIMSGYGDGRLNPSGQATRAEAAQMLKNFMEMA